MRFVSLHHAGEDERSCPACHELNCFYDPDTDTVSCQCGFRGFVEDMTLEEEYARVA